MKIFFYSNSESSVAEHFAKKLLSRKSMASMTVLPAGCKLGSHQSLELRNGDIMLLFASTDSDFEALLTLHDTFDTFRTILIIPEYNDLTLKWSHLFKPRFITFVDRDVTDLEEVINKIRTTRSL